MIVLSMTPYVEHSFGVSVQPDTALLVGFAHLSKRSESYQDWQQLWLSVSPNPNAPSGFHEDAFAQPFRLICVIEADSWVAVGSNTRVQEEKDNSTHAQ